MQINHLLTGSAGAGLIEVTQHVDPTQNTVGIIMQLIIGIVTLWKLIKKPKTTK
ncbi:hypothetical protein [Flavobacterium phycosphaerae]|uniref:hypothetical protein n=1 Tax=Flavobacterium phycosphaerae TaxID=2697515 RepID=UPI00138AE944|nr:hypothetical protein [Flavobacterium phycosphaerae]